MLFEIGLVAVGVAAGVTLAGGMMHRLYAWQRVELDAPDAATWRRGYEAGKAAARGMALHGDAYRPAEDWNAEVERRHNAHFGGVVVLRPGEGGEALGGVKLLAPGAPPEHRTWTPRHG